MTCPHCDSSLSRTTAPSADTPGWICRTCSRLWWPAELTPAARTAWNPHYRSHGFGEVGQMVRLAAMVNRDDARAGKRQAGG